MLSNGKAKAVGGGRKLKSEDHSAAFLASDELTIGNWSKSVEACLKSLVSWERMIFWVSFRGYFSLGFTRVTFFT